MEIRTEIKTLFSAFYNSSEGVIPGDRFTPSHGETYEVTKDHEFDGVKLKTGQKLKLIIKNKKHFHYRVS